MTLGVTAMSNAIPSCEFCGYKGHVLLQCRKYRTTKLEAWKPKHARLNNAVLNTVPSSWMGTESTAPASTAPTGTSGMTEFAGNVSCHSSEPALTSPSSHLWTTDTGATSHMMPHCHWFRDYSPLHVPIRLANNMVVYSKGVGNVVFNPVIDGKAVRYVELTWVLHIPDL